VDVFVSFHFPVVFTRLLRFQFFPRPEKKALTLSNIPCADACAMARPPQSLPNPRICALPMGQSPLMLGFTGAADPGLHCPHWNRLFFDGPFRPPSVMGIISTPGGAGYTFSFILAGHLNQEGRFSGGPGFCTSHPQPNLSHDILRLIQSTGFLPRKLIEW